MFESRKLVPQDRLFDILLSPGGGTFTANGKRFEGTGYVVADLYLTASGVTTKGQLATFFNAEPVIRALQDKRLIGKWTDPETNETEVNISDLFNSRIDALYIGKQRMQKAIGYIIDGVYQGDIDVTEKETFENEGRGFEHFSGRY